MRQAVILRDNLNQRNINPLSGLSELTLYDEFCFFIRVNNVIDCFQTIQTVQYRPITIRFCK